MKNSHGYLCRSVSNSSHGRREIALADFSWPRRLRSGMEDTMEKPTVLVVDDDREIARAIGKLLESAVDELGKLLEELKIK